MVAYSSKFLKKTMSRLHHLNPTMDIIFIGGLAYDNIETVLDKIDAYIYAGPMNEPYFTYDIWMRFKGKVINATEFMNDSNDVDVNELASAIKSKRNK